MQFLGGAVPQIVEQFHNLWNSDPLSAPVPLFGDCSTFFGTLFHKLWNCSTKSGTVPLCVGLLGYRPVFLFDITTSDRSITSVFYRVLTASYDNISRRFRDHEFQDDEHLS